LVFIFTLPLEVICKNSNTKLFTSGSNNVRQN
jgi:hypothetical protein